MGCFALTSSLPHETLLEGILVSFTVLMLMVIWCDVRTTTQTFVFLFAKLSESYQGSNNASVIMLFAHGSHPKRANTSFPWQ